MTAVRTIKLRIGCKAYYPRNEEEKDLAFSQLVKCRNKKTGICRCYVLKHFRKTPIPAPLP